MKMGPIGWKREVNGADRGDDELQVSVGLRRDRPGSDAKSTTLS